MTARRSVHEISAPGRNRRTLRCEEGAALVFVAVALGALCAVVGFSLSIGLLELEKNRAQAAVDAAALAGAAAIPQYNTSGDSSRVRALAEAFNEIFEEKMILMEGTSTSTFKSDLYPRNEVAGSGAAIDGTSNVRFVAFDGQNMMDAPNPSEATGIEVSKSYTVRTILDKFLGISGTGISVSAVASVGGPSCMRPRMPFALVDCKFSALVNHCGSGCGGGERQAYFAGYQEQGVDLDTAAFFSYDASSHPTDPASADFCKSLVRGNSGADPPDPSVPPLCVGSIVALNNGGVTSCLKEIEDQCSARGCSTLTPWEVDVPVISCDEFTAPSFKDSGGVVTVQEHPVRGFARIGITSVSSQGQIKFLKFVLKCAEVEGVAGGGKMCGLRAASPTLVR